ncbi:uncharacterized protein LOC142286186 [Anomaloglossus baeobatrachus]|uniref:uncharacterized protein LOC142286186 n=1 Tax=Anomaloglossus baeobatrachus TaxID=238106 RepID=UPI003F500B7F
MDFHAVYIAHHKESQQIFAMKKITKRSLHTERKVELAFLERDILTFSDCPFVVSMLCSFPTNSHLCMVMEYVGGGDCKSLLSKRGYFSVPLARLYFAEAILALEYLHSYGIVHRDLKLENLLITSTGHIKVTDFGLSKLGVMIPESNTYKELREDISREFMGNEFCGTPYYMAPEMILRAGYGRPVDWWAMGVILYQFLVGTAPFKGKSQRRYFTNVVSGDIIWTCDPAPPPDARNIITELLTKNPADRLGTEGAFQIKEHPFLRDLDFDNLLSQEPEYVPQLVSDVDTSVFLNHGGVDMDMASEDKEDNESPDFLNFTSSSQRLSKLCTTTTKTMNNDDTKSPPECSPESTPECITECSPESTPECSQESAPECSPERTPECSPESTPECIPECSPESTPECSQESAPECIPERTAECSPESTPECITECSPESTPECIPETIPECSPESTPECITECSPESTPECSQESAPECIPERTPECITECSPESTPECSQESAPECIPERIPECSPESTPECIPECSPESTPECIPETTPECSPESTPECITECSPESAPECIPERTPECSPESTPESNPEYIPESTPECMQECSQKCTPECFSESMPECSPECSPEWLPGYISENTPECSPKSTPAPKTIISKMQKESSPAPDRDDAITSLSSSSSLSEIPSQEERKSKINLTTEEQKSEKKEKGKKRRGNIFRRILSSCRRGLSRAARAFSCCCCSSTTI